MRDRPYFYEKKNEDTKTRRSRFKLYMLEHKLSGDLEVDLWRQSETGTVFHQVLSCGQYLELLKEQHPNR